MDSPGGLKIKYSWGGVDERVATYSTRRLQAAFGLSALTLLGLGAQWLQQSQVLAPEQTLSSADPIGTATPPDLQPIQPKNVHMEPAATETAVSSETTGQIQEEGPTTKPEPAKTTQPNRIKFTRNGLIAEAVPNQGGKPTQWRIRWGLHNLEDKTQSGQVFMKIDEHSSRPMAFKMRRYVEKELEIPDQNGRLSTGSRVTGTVIATNADGSLLALEKFAITLRDPPSNKINTTTSIKSGR